MNRVNIVKKLNEWVKKEFGSLYGVEDDGDLTITINGRCVIWFTDFKKDKFKFTSSSDDLSIKLIKEGIIEKIYDKTIELMSEYEPKYTVQVFPQDRGYLHVNHDSETSNDVTYDIGWPEDMYYLNQTEFTQSEIEELKKCDDVAVDWDKAIIKEVE